MSNEIFITFIIPTIGRSTLINSINSLLNQTDNNWNAIIVFDGIKQNISINDNRIKIIEITKCGLKNSAGSVRNEGIKLCNNSIWIGFLDDDDTLSKDYIEKLKEEINIHNNIDVCIFRMGYENGYILPSIYDKNIIRNKVGISFAIKKNMNDTILFENNPYEDYIFLKKMQCKKYKILISSYVTYFVRTNEYETKLFPKVLIN
jgi:glycosyltransferase involved in cell wall biosynthesis